MPGKPTHAGGEGEKKNGICFAKKKRKEGPLSEKEKNVSFSWGKGRESGKHPFHLTEKGKKGEKDQTVYRGSLNPGGLEGEEEPPPAAAKRKRKVQRPSRYADQKKKESAGATHYPGEGEKKGSRPLPSPWKRKKGKRKKRIYSCTKKKNKSSKDECTAQHRKKRKKGS